MRTNGAGRCIVSSNLWILHVVCWRFVRLVEPIRCTLTLRSEDVEESFWSKVLGTIACCALSCWICNSHLVSDSPHWHDNDNRWQKQGGSGNGPLEEAQPRCSHHAKAKHKPTSQSGSPATCLDKLQWNDWMWDGHTIGGKVATFRFRTEAIFSFYVLCFFLKFSESLRSMSQVPTTTQKRDIFPFHRGCALRCQRPSRLDAEKFGCCWPDAPCWWDVMMLSFLPFDVLTGWFGCLFDWLIKFVCSSLCWVIYSWWIDMRRPFLFLVSFWTYLAAAGKQTELTHMLKPIQYCM